MAAYGVLPPGADYAAWVGLWLNADRVRLRRLADVIDAVRIATGQAEMPRGWVDLLAGSREEAVRWHAEENRRSLAR